MKKLAYLFIGVVFGLALTGPAFATDAQAPTPKPQVLVTNVHVFDGKSEKRIMNANQYSDEVGTLGNESHLGR